ncbi:MAG TPA: carboxypeptidase-like regulatory domain-containing protein [Chitinophagaceae bacterium]|jgi:hypothetical protein|nr:carboxypeptidase-like regulatory domain-containing protein [Chitinophagaceae bacterium]
MKKILTLSLSFLLVTLSFAQLSVSGIVVDAESKLPLEGASVFAQNTTIGTITNKEGGYRLQLSKGGYDLIVSYTGYTTKTITVEASDDKRLDIELQKEDKSMSEVVIQSSNEVADGWQQYGSFFIKNFIGSTPFSDSCFLKNPEALKFYFYKRSNKLKVLATEPLQIANKSLGYNLNYALDSFVFYYKTEINSYRGTCLYTPMEGTSEEQKQWTENRNKTYYGSQLHFLRSYFDSTLKGEGFDVDLLSKRDNKKFNRLTNPYDTTYYFANDATGDVELWFPVKASITYNKEKPEAAYLQQFGLPADVKVQISYVDLLDAIIIKPNGFYLDNRSWINQGYWSWKNIADQLPYNYEPTGK